MGRVVVDSSETKEHDRQGPIPPGCLQPLRAAPVRIDSPWLFPTPTGRMWRINNFYRDVWRPARRASGIECTPQDFRHGYVSNLSAAGIDVVDLADISGHSVETAQKRYRHALRRSFEQVRQTIGRNVVVSSWSHNRRIARHQRESIGLLSLDPPSNWLGSVRA